MTYPVADPQVICAPAVMVPDPVLNGISLTYLESMVMLPPLEAFTVRLPHVVEVVPPKP